MTLIFRNRFYACVFFKKQLRLTHYTNEEVYTLMKGVGGYEEGIVYKVNLQLIAPMRHPSHNNN